MRGFRSIVLLIVVLGGLSAYIYFVTWKKPAATDAGTPQEKVFADLQQNAIDELTVKSASGDTTTLKKIDGVWQLTAPVAARADEAILSGIASNLASTTVTRVVEDNAADLTPYGLAQPRIDIAFKTAGDKDYRHLLIGEKSPTGADLFAKRGNDKRVFLISVSEESAFNHGTFDLRDKTLLRVDREKVDGLEVTADGKVLELTKTAGDWKIAKPIQARADFGASEGLVSRLMGLQMKSIVTPEAGAADLKKDGFDKPSASVDVILGSARATLIFGGKSDDSSVYVRDASKPAVMTIESSLVDDLKKGADEYRRKDIFEFRSFNATHVEITRNGQTVVFDKTKGANDKTLDTWRRAAPNAADADKDKMETALSKLSNLRASAFAEPGAKTGLDAPVLTIVVKFEDGKKEERISFGKVGGDTYASRPGEAGAAKVETNDFDDAVKALDEIAK